MKLLRPLFAVVPRGRASAALLLACFGLATTATSIVAVVPMYADAIQQAGFRRSLADAPPLERGVVAGVRTEPAQWRDQAATIGRLVDERLPGASRSVAIAETDSFGVVGDDVPEGTITSLATFETTEALLTVVEGDLDAEVEGAFAVWPTVDAAAALGVGIGDRLVLDGRADGETVVEVVAIVEPADRLDELWFDEPTVVEAVSVSGSFTEIGPLLTGPDSFDSLTRTVTGTWRGVVVPSSVDTADLLDLRRAAGGLEQAVRAELDDPRVVVDTGLPDRLTATDTAIGATGAVIAVILAQLVAVALYGLGFAAAVLASSRTGEAFLVRSRGASAWQSGSLAATEALVIVVPAVLVAPTVARAVVGLIERWGPVAATGLELDPRGSGVGVVASVAVGLVAAVVITWPAVRSARALADVVRPTTDDSHAGFLQRSGADIAIAVVAALSLWLLTRSGAGTRDRSGRLGADPVLVLAPALGVIAASLVTLRLVRLGTARLQRRTAAGLGLAPSLAAREVARRPARTARTSVLVVLSVTVGTFAAVLGASWERSQRDQADAAVAADLRVVPERTFGAVVGPLVQPAAYVGIPGVEAAVPIARPDVAVTRSSTRIPTVATDVASLPLVLRSRPDLFDLRQVDADADDGDGVGVLRETVPTGAVPLGPVAADLRIEIGIRRTGGDVSGSLGFAALVVDRFGTIHRVEADSVPVDATSATLVFPLGTDLVEGADRGSLGPLQLLRLEVTAPTIDGRIDPMEPSTEEEVPLPPPARFEITLGSVDVGLETVPFADVAWTAASTGALEGLMVAPVVEIAGTGDGLELVVETGLSTRPGIRTTVEVGPPTSEDDPVPTVPALVTPALLDLLALRVGDVASARIDGTSVDVRIVGTIDVVPFAVGESTAMLVDWSTLVAVRHLAGGRTSAPVEWALAVRADDVEAVTATLLGDPYASESLLDRRGLARRLSDDPLAIGLVGSLAVALVASLLVAVVGLLLTAVVGARERRSSHAVLTAMGTPRRVLRRWLVLESVPLVAVSSLAGLVAGIVLSRATLGSLTVAADGGRAIPTPAVVIPWSAVAAVVGVAFAAGVALPLLTGRLLGRHRAVDDLRIGDPT